jgi:hypothetical protein
MVAAPDAIVFDAVDIDPISVQIANARTNHRARVVECPIEEWSLSRTDHHGYGVVVGNVPFGGWRPARNNPHGDNLHNLSIARSVDMLAPGGVAALITSRFSLDAPANRGWRERLAGEVDLVGAFRLPSNTHREAGTAVVTDLLVLRRPLPGEQRPDPYWLDTHAHDLGDDLSTTVNAYWAAHPSRVLGEIEPGGAYRRENFSVRSELPAAQRLAAALTEVSVVTRSSCRPSMAASCRPGRSSSMRRLLQGSLVTARSIVAPRTRPKNWVH